MGISVKIVESLEETAGVVVSVLRSAIAGLPAGESCSWVISGGTTPAPVFREIAASYNDAIDWRYIKVFWVDERCVGPEDVESNYKMAKENLLDHVPLVQTNIFRIRGEADPETEAIRYSNIFAGQVRPYRGVHRADVILLGLGDDGHTASIFPGNMQLFKSKKLFDVAVKPGSKQKRITATGNVINHAGTVIFLVSGASKAEKVACLTGKGTGREQYPASMVDPEGGELIWLLDKSAAGKIQTIT